eukprot:2211706-Prymnesium_polylepis.2
MNGALGNLNGVISALAKSAGAAERVLSLLALKPDIPHALGYDASVAVCKWDIRFEDVSFHYQMRPSSSVLDGLSFGVDEGSVAALVGRSGGGKSTVIHLLLRFYDPIKGRISIGGIDLRELNLRTVHQRIGLVSQDTQLCAGSESNTGRVALDFCFDRMSSATDSMQLFVTTLGTALPISRKRSLRLQRGRRKPMTSYHPSRTGFSLAWAIEVSDSPVGSGNESPLLAAFSGSLGCCCSTRPPPLSTPRVRALCSALLTALSGPVSTR